MLPAGLAFTPDDLRLSHNQVTKECIVGVAYFQFDTFVFISISTSKLFT